MWLNLEAGIARSLRRRSSVAFDVPPSPDPRWSGRRALVVEAAHTYFPEADLSSLPSLAAAEIDAGLSGRLRQRIAATDPDDPGLSAMRDELIARLGHPPDVSGALSVVDRVYTGRLLRQQVPPVITAACVAWYGHWRSSNGGPALDVARALHDDVEQWVEHPDRRTEIDVDIVGLARQLAGDDIVALEDQPV